MLWVMKAGNVPAILLFYMLFKQWEQSGVPRLYKQACVSFMFIKYHQKS